MANTPLQLRILIIEDNPEHARYIQKAIEAAAKARMADAVQLYFHNADTNDQARDKIKETIWHGISIDQNMPESKGGAVSQEGGYRFIGELEGFDPPAYRCVFTAYPTFEGAHIAGSNGQTPYKIKAIKSKGDGRALNFRDYGIDFFNEMIDHYLWRVLKLVSQTGFADLKPSAHKALNAYDAFQKAGFAPDEEAEAFLAAFFQFIEQFNMMFAGLTLGLAHGAKFPLPQPRSFTHLASLTGWVEDAWGKPEMDGLLKSVASHFPPTDDLSFVAAYRQAMDALRRERNARPHGDYNFNAKAHNDLRWALFRIADVVAFVARLPMMTQIHKTRDTYLRYKELNREMPERSEIQHPDPIPDGVNPDDLFTMFPGPQPHLVPIHGGITIDNEGNNGIRLTWART